MKTIIGTAWLAVSLLGYKPVRAQVYGCTDPQANNYDASATANNGSCVYNALTVNVTTSVDLPAALEETSGLALWSNRLITQNDNSDSTLYAINLQSGAIEAQYPINGAMNTDWEEVAADENYLYIGDVGNNVNGNRTDLHILRVSKASLLSGSPVADTIRFSYSDQSNFTPAGENNTDFDCEAFWVTDDSIYLATKQWISHKSSLYALPKIPGDYVADYRATLNADGLITGATQYHNGAKHIVALSGYSTLLQPFVYLLYDYPATGFFAGNKRKVQLNLPFHQLEGISTANGLIYYLSNERFTQAPLVDIKQQLHTLDLDAALSGYLSETSGIGSPAEGIVYTIYPNPAKDYIFIDAAATVKPEAYTLIDARGVIVAQGMLQAEIIRLDVARMTRGIYWLTVGGSSRKVVLR